MSITPAIIFLCAIVFCIGAALGGIIERGLRGRSVPRPPIPLVKNELAREGEYNVFSAWRRADNQLWLEMDGRRLDSREALIPEQRQRLLNLLLDLRPWLETTQASTGPAVAPQPVESSSTVPEVSAQPMQTKKNQPATAGEEAKPEAAPDSIIEQIDKVLQAKLVSSELKDREIRLTEGPGSIVIIQDGPNRYEGIDAVADPQVKALIQQAVADWEKSTK